MNISEVIAAKVTSRDFKIISEGISDEIHRLTVDSVSAPFNEFKKLRIASFSKKLYAWAWSTMQFLKKTADYNQDKQYIKTLAKIINSPNEVAEQIFNTIIAKSTKPANASTAFTPPDDLEDRLAQLGDL